MTQFSPTPREPRQTARMRRLANAFQPFGGDGSTNITHNFTNRGYYVSAMTGSDSEPIIQALDEDENVILSVDNTGASQSPEKVNNTVLTGNTTLANSTINQIISIDPGAILKVTLPASSTLTPGTWVGLQDVNGSAGTNTIKVDPNNGASGFTINGGTGAIDLVTQDNGIGYVRLLKDDAGNTNWFAETSAPPGGSSSAMREISVNTTSSIASSAQVVNSLIVFCNTSAGSMTLTLPACPNYGGFFVLVKKTTTDGNALLVDTRPTFGETIDTPATNTVTSLGGRAGFTFYCDGSDWFLTANTRPYTLT